jgi:hypothetical protein
MTATNPQLEPGSILQTAFAFWSSKVLLTAVEFGVFTQLGSRRRPADRADCGHSVPYSVGG